MALRSAVSRALRWDLWIWAGAFLAAFLLGRRFSSTGNDFIVYHTAARSLLAGRVDLYSSTFALGPPMVYVYPPLFLLLVFPIGWLSLPDAFGLCFALMALAVALTLRLVFRAWRPGSPGGYAASIILIAGPYAVLCFRSGNAHLFVALLVLLALVAWSRGQLWRASAALALGGAVKLFPLFLAPVFVARRDWRLLARTVAFTLLLWSLPALYFGPRQTVELYRSWIGSIGADFGAYKRQRAMDLSLPGAMERWLAPVDYSTYVDPGYPQVNFAALAPQTAKRLGSAAAGFIAVLSLWMCAKLRPFARDNPRSLAAAGAIFIVTILLVGPYTPIQHLSAWLIVVAALPAVLGHRGRLALAGIGLFNALLFAVPGSASQRAFQASGVFTVIGLMLWGMAMAAGFALIRERAQRPPDHR